MTRLEAIRPRSDTCPYRSSTMDGSRRIACIIASSRSIGSSVSGSFASSKIAPNGVGSTANMPATAPPIPQPNQTMFVSEVFYNYKPATPIGQLLNFRMTNALYDAAFF